MAFKLADRIADLPNYPFVAISANVRQLQMAGEDVIRLDMGSPDMPPPQAVIDTLYRVAQMPNKHGYSGYRGIPEFRQAVSRYYKRVFDVALNPETEVLPLLGSKEGLMGMVLATVSPGDVVLVPTPGYPTYSMSAHIAGAEVYLMPLLEENNFLPDVDAIPQDVAQKARVMWLNYPNNPTGALASVADYERYVEFCAAHDILLLSDNPYFQVTFTDDAPTSALQPANAKNHVAEFMSLSKSHNMAGWRLGACVGRSEAIDALLRFKSNIDSGHFMAVYEAGICALDTTSDNWIAERNQSYEKRVNILVDAAEKIGLQVDYPPKGALYIWASVLDGDDVAYASGALQEAGVSVVPGSTYGDAGKGYVRISIVQSEARIAEAVERIAKWRATL